MWCLSSTPIVHASSRSSYCRGQTMKKHTMKKPDEFFFRMTVETHDHTGELLAVYIRIRKGKVATTKEHANGNLMADYDKHGKLLGIEMIGPCEAGVLFNLADKPSAKRFVQSVVPRGMIRKAA